MKAIIQRVTRASVTVGGEKISEIGKGLCVLFGISKNDTEKDMEFIVRKILNLRVFRDDEETKWKKSVKDMDFEILCVSQFTLQCVLKGNKPDFHRAMSANESENYYNTLLNQLKKNYKEDKIKDGKFGNYMQVDITNDGPVTIEINSQQTTKNVEATKP